MLQLCAFWAYRNANIGDREEGRKGGTEGIKEGVGREEEGKDGGEERERESGGKEGIAQEGGKEGERNQSLVSASVFLGALVHLSTLP